MQIALAAPRMQPDEPELEAALAAVEQRLHGLGRALRDHATAPVEIWADDPAAERELGALAAGRGLAFSVIGAGRFRVDPRD